MQASDRVLAGRYAAALFQAASAKNEEQKVQADLGSAHKLLLDAMATLRHPRVPPASKKKLVHDSLTGKVGPTTLRFLDLLIDKKRFDLMIMIAAVYAKLAADKRGAAKAHVRALRIERARSHHLFDALPGALEERGVARQVFPEVVHVGDAARLLDVVEHRAHLARCLGILDWLRLAHLLLHSGSASRAPV